MNIIDLTRSKRDERCVKIGRTQYLAISQYMHTRMYLVISSLQNVVLV